MPQKPRPNHQDSPGAIPVRSPVPAVSQARDRALGEVHPDALRRLQAESFVTCGFSGGRDSLVCAVILKELGISYLPIYHYHVPDLPTRQRWIEQIERWLGVEVVQMPHPMLYDYLRHQDFQEPKMIDFLHELDLPRLDFDELREIALAERDLPGDAWDVVGLRANESFNRRMRAKKSPFLSEASRRIYPIEDWSVQECRDFLAHRGAPVPPDYAIWPRSFDGLKYQFLFGVREHWPEDWKIILEYFPLIELELFRYEANQRHVPAVTSARAAAASVHP